MYRGTSPVFCRIGGSGEVFFMSFCSWNFLDGIGAVLCIFRIFVAGPFFNIDKNGNRKPD